MPDMSRDWWRSTCGRQQGNDSGGCQTQTVDLDANKELMGMALFGGIELGGTKVVCGIGICPRDH